MKIRPVQIDGGGLVAVDWLQRGKVKADAPLVASAQHLDNLV